MFDRLNTRFARFAFTALAALAVTGQAKAADEVKLLKVESISPTYKGGWHDGSFEAVVANLAYAKNVSVHYKKQNGTWGDFPLAYNRAATAGKEVWSGKFYRSGGGSNFDSPASPMEFALKYVVNGATYWDNNGGSNYIVNHETGTILWGPNVYLDDYVPTVKIYNNTFNGVATVKNLGVNKSVQVHYSTNNWQTTQIANASYSPSFWSDRYSSVSNPNSHGFEEWTFGINVGTATQIEYAIKYTVNGQTYWDNNFGRNYSTTLTR